MRISFCRLHASHKALICVMTFIGLYGYSDVHEVTDSYKFYRVTGKQEDGMSEEEKRKKRSRHRVKECSSTKYKLVTR